jgi:Flp pilus assembly protein TadB
VPASAERFFPDLIALEHATRSAVAAERGLRSRYRIPVGGCNSRLSTFSRRLRSLHGMLTSVQGVLFIHARCLVAVLVCSLKALHMRLSLLVLLVLLLVLLLLLLLRLERRKRQPRSRGIPSHLSTAGKGSLFPRQ